MKNELWQVLLQSGWLEEQIESCRYEQRKAGNPYKEVEQQKIDPRQSIEINPYVRLYTVLAPILEEEWRGSPEGKVLFQVFTELIFEIDRYQGCRADSFVKERLQEEIENGCFGREISRFFGELTTYQKNGTLDHLLMRYRGREQIYSFVYEMQLLFPSCLIFREKREAGTIYICMGTGKKKELEWQYECVKKLFLSLDVKICLTWENPFLLTDMNDIEILGNKMA